MHLGRFDFYEIYWKDSVKGFKSFDLFKFINEILQGKYCVRCTKYLEIYIVGKSKIKKLDDITSAKSSKKYFYNIKLTAQEYICNMAVCKDEDTDDIGWSANNISKHYAIRAYKKRFDIE